MSKLGDELNANNDKSVVCRWM